jgi:ligand-binding sensor domain-containing protein/serine phosphatase RsbU (regulator of sigma subunit)
LPEPNVQAFFLMRISKVIFYLLLLFLFQNYSVAQQYNFKNYTTKNGLSNSTINNIFQDSKGFIWFSTQGGGVSVFNGKNFKKYTKEDGLISNEVTCVTEDKKGNIWIGTSSGISKFDRSHFTNYSEKEGLKSADGVYWILADKNGYLWCATRGAGVSRFDGNKFIAFSKKEGLASDQVFCIAEDKRGDLWFGLDNGISKYDGKKIINYDTVTLLKHKIFFSSYTDSRGNIWFGSIGDGVIKYNGVSFTKIDLPESIKNDFIGSIAEDKKGNIWFATEHGVLKQERNRFHLFNEKEGLSSNGVLSVCSDYEGNMWIGTQGGGVNLFNNESFVNYTEKDGLTSKSISDLYQADDENYLVGTTSQGLNFFNSKNNSFITTSGIAQIDQSVIYSVIVDHSKKIWAGTQDGVFVLEKQNNSYKIIKDYSMIGNIRLLAALKIIEDKEGNIWIASYGSGLFKVKDGILTNFNKKNGFISDNVLTVFEDSKGIIWIGTKDAGLVKYDGKVFINYDEKAGLTDKTIWSITEDNNGVLFFGTGESGVGYLENNTFKTISTTDGLCSNYVPALKYDNVSNCLWIGTEKGINKLTFRENFAIASLRYYGEQEGYKGTEVNQNAILIDRSGTVWFGTINGLSRYNRQYDSPNITPPKLHLNGIRLAYQNVDWKKYADSVDRNNLPVGLTLSHKNNNLSFDFQAFTTDNVKYTFILEGQDEEWSPLSSNPEAVFTNINPGKSYTFKAKAVNSNGVWSKNVIEFSFKINPPWWQTWWFYTLVIVIVLTSIFGFINYRTAQLAKEKKVLEEKVTERTMELRDANDQLSVAFQDIKDSINYAKKIQDAILPLDEEIKRALPQSFVLFKPRDVVSGDFYWFNKKDDKVFIAAVDCTGHGVPGAFMSMIGSSLLNEIITKKGPHDAASVLKKLHQGVRKSLKQDRDSYESKDGMDLALVVLDTTTNTLQYSGAKRPLFYFNAGNFEEIKADKQSIGGLEMEDNYSFTNNDFEVKKGDTFYLFTDGYVDQFGGDKEKKYSTKRFKETLAGIQTLPLAEQKTKLDETIENWKSGIEQIDDILVIGIRF